MEGARRRHAASRQRRDDDAAAAGTSTDRPDRTHEPGRGLDPPALPWVLDWLSNRLLESIVAAWTAFTASGPVQAVWRLSVVQYVYSLFALTFTVFFQRLGMLELGPVDFVGGPGKGLTAIVTGPTSGIGYETAAALARRGARVILACRNVARGEELKVKLQQDTVRLGHALPEIEVWHLDLASLASVREFAAQWEQQQRELHVLINNAGIFSMGAPRGETEDGFEAHIGANHLGHFLLTLMLVPSLRRGAAALPSFGARVVHVASMNHLMASSGMRTSDPHLRLPKSYDAAHAYAASKLAQILFMKEMRRRLGPESPLQVFAVHPGMVVTNVVRTLPGPLQYLYRLVFCVLLLSPSEGSRASIYAATSPKAPLEGWKSFGYIDANCRPVATSPAGQDMMQALWVWKWSAEQVQLPAHLDLPEA